MEYEIKPYEEKYAEKVARLGEEFMDFLIPLDFESRLRRTPEYGKFSLERKVKRLGPQTAFYVALVRTEPVGFVFGAMDPTPPPQAWYGMHPYTQGTGEELYVKPEYRGKGIGRALMQKVEEFFRQNNCEYISISVLAFNKDAAALYERLGFHPRGVVLSKKLAK